MIAPSSKFHGKIFVGFVLTIGKRFFLEVSFQSQQKEHNVLLKTALEILKIAIRLLDRHVFKWHQSKF